MPALAFLDNIYFIQNRIMNIKSVQRVEKIVENSVCSVDLLWKKRLLRKHSSEEEMEEEARRCFGGHGRVIAK